VVHVPVKAIGKKSSTVFPFPKFSLSLIRFGPSAVFVDKVKSGALVPTASGMSESSVCDFGTRIQYRIEIGRVKTFLCHSERSEAESRNPAALLLVLQRDVSTSLDMTMYACQFLVSTFQRFNV